MRTRLPRRPSVTRRPFSLIASALIAGSLTFGCGGEDDDGGKGGTTAWLDKTLSIYDLGPKSSSFPFTFALGEGALGFTVHAQFPLHAGFETIRAPNGQLVVEDASIPGTDAKFRAYPTFADVTGPYDVLATIPQSDSPDAMPPAGGNWEIQFRGQIGNTIAVDNVRVMIRFFPSGQFEQGRLDVNAIIAGQSTTTEEVEQRLQTALSDFAGLKLGTVTHYSVDQTAEIVDDEVEFRELLRSTGSIVEDKPALNVFFVRDMSKLFTVSKSGGEPGLTAWHGSYIGGIVMEASKDIALDSLFLRHEIGHMAGLFDTTAPTEGLTKGLTDGLSDTPACDNTLQLSFCPDSNNIMFPFPNPNWSPTLTASQQRIIQGGSLYIGDDGTNPSSGTQSFDAEHAYQKQQRQLRRFDFTEYDPASKSTNRWKRDVSALPPPTRRTLMSFCGRHAAPHNHVAADHRSTLSRIARDPHAPSYVSRRAARMLEREKASRHDKPSH